VLALAAAEKEEACGETSAADDDGSSPEPQAKMKHKRCKKWSQPRND